MDSTKAVLSAVKRKLEITSDYALAKKMGVTESAVSKWQNGRGFLDPNSALKAAEILEVSPLRIIAIAEAERAKRPEQREKWRRLSHAAMLAGALVSAGIFSGIETSRGSVGGEKITSLAIHYAKRGTRRKNGKLPNHAYSKVREGKCTK